MISENKEITMNVSNVDPEKLAKVLQKHRRIKAYDWVGWACTCGTPVINNTMQTLSMHQAEIVLDYLRENNDQIQ